MNIVTFTIRKVCRVLFAVALLSVLGREAKAQWVEQKIVLRPGWNAVFLEVAPAVDGCDAAFSGLPVESVWDWNRRGNPVQFVQDPTTLIPGAPDWLTWFPPTHPLRAQANLFALRDGRPYLIKLADNAAPVTWSVIGKPSLRRIDWHAGGVNFAGFRVSTNSSLSFASLFAGDPGLAGQPVYQLNSAGAWEPIANLASAGPKAGEAYWIRCKTASTRSGTIEVDGPSREGLKFSRSAPEQSIRIRNTSGSARNVSIRLLASATPPAGAPALAGPAPIEYRHANFAQAEFGWKRLDDTLSFNALPPGGEWNVRLAVRLAGLNAAPGAEFQSILEVTDNAGALWLVPVSVRQTIAPSAFHALNDGADVEAAGLWIGEAVVDAVSQPAHPSDPETTRTAGGKFQFRLIVHVDSGGTARLLQQVYLVRKPPVFKPDPENPGYEVIDQPGRTVVLTDEALIAQIIGPGEVLGRRTSSAAFGFKEPLSLSGEFGEGSLTGSVVLGYNDPLNPFKHLYHPDHNNLDDRYEQQLPEGKESFTVTRALSLQFTATDPLGLNPPGWGDTEMGGVYRETITGLHRKPIHVSGTFRLVRVSSAVVLNQ